MSVAPGPLPTLGSHLRADVVFSIWCATCQSFGRKIEPAELIVRFGDAFLTKDVERHLCRTRCGQRSGEIIVSPRLAPFTGYPPPVGAAARCERVGWLKPPYSHGSIVYRCALMAEYIARAHAAQVQRLISSCSFLRRDRTRCQA